MMYSVYYTPEFLKNLNKLDSKTATRVKKKLLQLEKNPFLGKKLHGEMEDKFTLRVWPYRVIYSVDKVNNTIQLKAVKHRQGVYK